MAKHISRQELKTNQVQEALSHGAEAVLSHRSTLIYVIIVVVIVAAGIFGWRFYSQRQSVKAEAGFNDAMQVYEALVVGPGQPPQQNEITYSDAPKKFQDALKKFEDVMRRYPRTRSGQLAKYYSALCEEHLGQNSQAISALTEIGNSSDHDFAAMARFELAQIYDQMGKSDQAVQIYNELLANPSVLAPKPIVLLALAGHYRQSNPAQAVKLYQQIKTEYPDTSAADEADQQLALLPAGKS
ncbi:MAG: tetratricopeptide repeat protein [Candidatus Acidiferrales bacterium]